MVNVNFSPDGPVFPPPEGRQSNWIDPEDQTTFIITSHAICLVFVTVFVVLRLYTKVFIARKISLDDCTTLPEWRGICCRENAYHLFFITRLLCNLLCT